MVFAWTRRPGVVLADTRLVDQGNPEPYTLTLPRRGQLVFEDLANLSTEQNARQFTARWGWLTENPRHTWVSPVLNEAATLRACLEIWKGTADRRSSNRLWGLRAGGVKRLRELTLGSDDEWQERWKTIRNLAAKRATDIASAWLWVALRRGLDGLRLLPVKDGPPDVPWHWDPFGPWRWHLEVPDLRTFCYVELAAAMTRGRLPSWCPFCGEVYLVQKEGRQMTCGKNQCRQAAHRAKVLRERRRRTASRGFEKAVYGKTATRR